MKVDSIVVYRSFISALRKIKDPAERCRAYDAMFDYGMDHIETPLEDGAGIALELIKPLLDSQYQRKMINRENGKKGGRPSVISSEEPDVKTEKNRNKPNKTEAKANESLMSNVNGNGNVNVNSNKRFVKPTIQEISDYCLEKQIGVDPERFYNYYESNGWMVGRVHMKDWRACLQNWKRNSVQKQDHQQTYDTSKNRKLSEQELNELLALRSAK